MPAKFIQATWKYPPPDTGKKNYTVKRNEHWKELCRRKVTEKQKNGYKKISAESRWICLGGSVPTNPPLRNNRNMAHLVVRLDTMTCEQPKQQLLYAQSLPSQLNALVTVRGGTGVSVASISTLGFWGHPAVDRFTHAPYSFSFWVI